MSSCLMSPIEALTWQCTTFGPDIDWDLEGGSKSNTPTLTG